MYDYLTEKPELLTDKGQRHLLYVRDHVQAMLKTAGAFRMQEAMVGGGSSWQMLACVDRLVELGEIREITAEKSCAGQHRVFVNARPE